jgi:PAS domain S-box-containing protein
MNNIFDSIISGVITIDANGKVLTANAASLTILAHDDPIHKKIDEVFPAMNEKFYETLEQVMDDGEQQFLIEEPVIKPGGQRHWNLIISPLRDADGNIHGLAMVLDDLTEQKRAEAQLAEVRRYVPPALLDSMRGMESLNIEEGQERTITMISCDVRGFTSFSETLQPEELMETINKYLSLASDAINLYEGIVDKYMGDAVTGLFNTQINPQSDHAVRGVRAAMNIIYDLYALHEILPENERLFYGIGVHTDQAFLGNVGGAERKEFSALGDAATISKILEGNAGPGEVIISEATYDLVKDYFECEERVPANTKGRDDLTKVYHVIKRKKGMKTGTLFLDPEFQDLMESSGKNSDD